MHNILYLLLKLHEIRIRKNSFIAIEIWEKIKN